jgi:hypothetical protein
MDVVFSQIQQRLESCRFAFETSFELIILDGIRELFLEDARDFMKSRQLYIDRRTSLILLIMLWHLTVSSRIPFSIYLLNGAPGSESCEFTRRTGSESCVRVRVVIVQ